MAHISFGGTLTPGTLADADQVQGYLNILKDVINGNLDNTNLVDASISGAKLATAAVTASKLAGNSVTSGALAANAVTTSKLADGSVTNSKIGTGLDASKVTSGTLPAQVFAPGIIGTTMIQDSSISASKMSPSSVGTNSLIDGAVTAAKLAAQSVSNSHIELGTILPENLSNNLRLPEKINTYEFLRYTPSGGATLTQGSNTSGSNLERAKFTSTGTATTNSTNPPGTWKNMGPTLSPQEFGLFVRVS